MQKVIFEEDSSSRTFSVEEAFGWNLSTLGCPRVLKFQSSEPLGPLAMKGIRWTEIA